MKFCSYNQDFSRGNKMLFNSYHYAVFLPIVFILYWLIPHKYRWGIVLVSSYYFYMCWNAKYLLLIMFITGISFAGALLVERAKEEKRKRLWVGVVIGISLALLFVFKYFNFMGDTITVVLQAFSISTPDIALSLLLPVGISFYTFQSIGYIVDVYRGELPAEHHFGKYAAFVAFFPQLVAGPIERASNLLPQLKKECYFNYEQATYGLKLMTWGYFKKIVVADTLAGYVDKVYSDLHFYPGSVRLFVAFLFSIQIYCDFSGYSDIARGTAKLLGIELMENFKSPYFAASIREFWQRWHISLSTWFKDYVYIPLGGNRVSKARNSFNLLTTFLLSGLWHGASWTFVFWGGLHGTVQVAEKNIGMYKKSYNKVIHCLKIIITFCVVSMLWVFFRAQNIKDALYIIVYWYHGLSEPMNWLTSTFTNLGITFLTGIQLTSMILLLLIYDYISLKKDVIDCISKWNIVARWILYVVFVVLIFFWSPANGAEFIYFDF